MPWAVERLVEGSPENPELRPFEARLHSMTTDKRDSGAGSNNTRGAWRNPLLLLPKALAVEQGDEIVIETEVERLGEKGPAYTLALTHHRGGQQLGQMSETYTQKDLFPWTRRKCDGADAD